MDKNIPDIKGKGVYCLMIRNDACSVNVGRFGNVDLRSGYHIYVGSALGPGGLKRLSRHISLSIKKEACCPHWHIDHLLMHPAFELVSVVYAFTSLRLECLLARHIGGGHVPGFGCSDCSCGSHLFYRRGWPEKEIIKAFYECDLQAVTIPFSSGYSVL
ncbi:MAG: DUF123 domain-containing protein [Methanosarcinaceae archaeon]|nr:DUF123 domain-containing protein [Methanosarcinaceae archaeon]